MNNLKQEENLENFEKSIKTHQELAEKLDLYMTHEFCTGSIFLKPNGTKIWRALEEYIRDEYKKRGFNEVMTPQLASSKLFKQSGHYDNYRENMFCIQCTEPSDSVNTINSIESSTTEVSDTMYMKPMNCPFHCLMFAETLRSYRQLPIRFADFGCLHRNELSGALRGLNRLRKFSQDDAHIFCMEDQIFDEIKNCMGFLSDVYSLFGFNYRVTLSTRPDKFLGNIKIWENAEKSLMNALDDMKITYEINEKDGAFYGPKIDIMVKDSMNREVQCGTIQLDFQLPTRFELEYIDKDGQPSIPVIIHRAILGSLERMMGILLEHFQGKMPLWLSPRQVAIIPVTWKPNFIEYCNKVKEELVKFDSRLDSVHIFDSSEIFPSRVRDAEVKLYNYVLIVGEKEIDSNSVTTRIVNHKRDDRKLVPVGDVYDMIKGAYFAKTEV